jgi:hypothetical protein
MLFDHVPSALKNEIYEWLRENAKDERKASDTDEQFFYKTRQKALGPFKRKLWDLPDDVKATMAKAYDAKFEFLFTQLAVGKTAPAVAEHVKAIRLHRPMPGTAGYENVAAAPDDTDLSD